MATERFANNVITTISAAMDATQTSITVVSSSGFPTACQFRVVCQSELILVTAVSSNTWTIVRGIEGSSATSHPSGTTIGLVLTSSSLAAVAGLPCQGRLTLLSGDPAPAGDQ